MYSIYVLLDPMDAEIRYVGRTKDKLSRRLSHHISNARYSKHRSPLYEWILSLVALGLKPLIIKAESFDSYEDSKKAEAKYIATCSNQPILNLFLNPRPIRPLKMFGNINAAGRTIRKKYPQVKQI